MIVGKFASQGKFCRMLLLQWSRGLSVLGPRQVRMMLDKVLLVLDNSSEYFPFPL